MNSKTWLSWLAAPFGTEEYLWARRERCRPRDRRPGQPGLTKTGTANAVLPIRYLADSPFTIYQPGRPQDADTQHKYQSKEIPTGVSNPTTGLFSNTAASKNATADKTSTTVNDVIQGRRPYEELKTLVSTWKSAVGDAMQKDAKERARVGAAPRRSDD